MLSIFLTIACWAPEVKAPEPKLSPREIASLEEGTERQSASQAKDIAPKPEPPPTDTDIEASKETEDTNSVEENPEAQEVETEEPETQEVEPNPIEPEKKEPPRNYPFSTKTKVDIPLLGRGGGQIIIIPAGSSIDVLEKQETGLHIICVDCSPNRPRQAGFIALDAI
jgi:hypothetical protein